MSTLTLDQLERPLFQACDTLRSRLDPQEYRHYVIAILLLRFINDRFLDARQKISADLRADGLEEDLITEVLEETDRYKETFFVPAEARWSARHGAPLGQGIEDLAPDQERPIAVSLDEALDLVEQANLSRLEGVFSASRFAARSLSDELLAEFIANFNKISLCASDLAYPGLVGTLCDQLFVRFAEESKKKGGESYTQPPLARLLVQILAPEPSMSLYDPVAGVGGTLVQAHLQASRSADAKESAISLTGQELDGSVAALCRMNLILHDIHAEIVAGDTLTMPGHTREGALQRFDRVLGHLPPSGDYKSKDLTAPERFTVMMPETGKKADLMFVQHMLASLSSTEAGDERDGWMVAVVPQGALQRGGPERALRKQLVDDGLLEAVIALPSFIAGNASILVLSRDGRRERSNVMFVRAEPDSKLAPEDIEKIVSVWEGGEDVEGMAQLVSVAEIAATEYNLDPREHVRTEPAPEPNDVSAHLHGGIPLAEIAGLDRWLKHYPGTRELLFQEGRSSKHAELLGGLAGPSDIRVCIDGSEGPRACEGAVAAAFDQWWASASRALAQLPENKNVYALQAQLLEELTSALGQRTLLSSYQVRGALLRFYDEGDSMLRTIAASGWVSSLIPKGEILASQRPELVRQIEEKTARITSLTTLFDAARLREENNEETETAGAVLSPSEAKALKERQKEVKSELSQIVKFVKASVALVYGQSQRWGGAPPKEYTRGLSPSAPDFSGVNQLLEEVGDNPAVATQVEELRKMITRGERLNEDNSGLEGSLTAHKAFESELRQLKTELRELEDSVDRVVEDARATIAPDAARDLVLQRLQDELKGRFSACLQNEQRAFTDAVVALVEKYAQPYHALEQRRTESLRALSGALDKLGYTL